ncbi:alpha-(1,6)-fucosyltransferase [Phlebotomus argentipes]|uniref:alpha-(1,6)-fucosyltransferase n=1 Tax=Phlebotomus argentipes TaxID=94469 RepID=UPI002892F7BA|nr:alpha-(1,6)-fucosyltransferase [Phlebotomus argentipes]
MRALNLSSRVQWFIIVIILWGATVLLSLTNLTSSGSNSKHLMENDLRRLNRAISYVNMLESNNNHIENLLREHLEDGNFDEQDKKELAQKIEVKIKSLIGSKTQSAPPAEYDNLLRRIYTNTQEMYNFVNAEMSSIKIRAKTANPEVVSAVDEAMKLLREHKGSLLTDIEDLRRSDGHEQWREQEFRNLSNLVQQRLHRLQNPADCSNARKIVCRLNKGCGYGCQLHHVVYCFIMAYATERTLILKSKGWRYHKAGWEEIFQPVSETCVDVNGKTHANWPGKPSTQVLTLPIIDSLHPRPEHLPLAIPADLAPRLTRIHGDPFVWWVGQFLKYLLRPQASTQQMLDTGIRNLGFKNPIVGVHIRRTDKVGTEAAFHSLAEYMTAVDEFYDQLELRQSVDKRRVYIASDDYKVIEEARSNYPHYEVVGDPNVARMAAVSSRYTDFSLNGIILDTHLLSLSDYLVCTFSSQVCRVAYEIMQTLHTEDATQRFKSLDDIYYYGGQNAHNRRAVLPHTPRNSREIVMQKNDLISIAGNHWNGFSKGKNTRTNQVGLFPSFKVVDKVEVADFPTYNQKT